MSEAGYLLSNTAAETADRFAGLEQTFDPGTIRHLSRLVKTGGRCLELGAGSGSIARWLSQAVGPSGRVLATDLDVRWVRQAEDAPLEVVQHDLVTEPVPDGPWDLIHERLVLVHLPDRLAVLDRLVEALAPGGWLVLEDFDTGEVRTTDRQGPDHELIVRVAVAFNDMLGSRGAATSFAADTPRHLTDRGLVDVGASGYVAIDAGGGGFARVLAANIRQVGEALIGHGLSKEDIDRYLAVLDSPSTFVGSPVLITSWGRRAESASRADP